MPRMNKTVDLIVDRQFRIQLGRQNLVRWHSDAGDIDQAHVAHDDDTFTTERAHLHYAILVHGSQLLIL